MDWGNTRKMPGSIFLCVFQTVVLFWSKTLRELDSEAAYRSVIWLMVTEPPAPECEGI